MPADSNFLFVYGTLASCTNHRMGRTLQERATLVSTATFQGTLYLVDDQESPPGGAAPVRYPACVPSDDPSDLVHGELYSIISPGVLADLDAYEECSTGFPEPHEYLRRIRQVALPDGRSVPAWIYLYNLPTDTLAPTPDGQWAEQA